MSARFGVTLVALAWVGQSIAVPAPAAAQTLSLAFGQCSPAQVVVHTPGLECATLDVPFDRADVGVGDIALAVQRVRPSAPRAGVIVLLAGGPGQPALPAFESLIAPLGHQAALRGFELVAFDQRGTGQSEALQCPEESGLAKGGLSAGLGACGTALGATLTLYSSQESVEDLDALRQALGGTPLSLVAVSYGGRVAGMYAREHPQGLARMVLDSPAPVTGSDALETERVRALRRVLNEGICWTAPCRSFSRNVYSDLVAVVARLHRHPLRTRIYDARGRLRAASVTESGLFRLLLGLDVTPTVRELAPAAIAAAAHGDAAPLARLTGSLGVEGPAGGSLAATGDPAATVAEEAVPLSPLAEPQLAAGPPIGDLIVSMPLFLATYCVENELPWSPQSSPGRRSAILRSWLASLPPQATAPFAAKTVAAASALPLCLDWPATPPAPPSPTSASAAPTLILSGDDDLRTPYEQDLTVAAGYTDVRLLRVPDDGHSTISTDRTGCAMRAMIEFLSTGTAPESCPGSREPQALPLPASSLSEAPPGASASRVAGEVATATAMTLEDLFGQSSFSGGGLRGGSWTLQLGGFRLDRMVDVPGVAVSGMVHVAQGATATSVTLSAHLAISGRLAGTLVLRGLTLTGRVGGARVRARLAAL